MAILTPTGGLSDAGGGGQYQTSYDSLPYVSSRGFTAPTDAPSEPPIDTGTGSGFVTRETQFNPRGLGTPGEGTLPLAGGGDSGGASGGGSPFDKLLAAFGSLGGATGGGGGGGVLATQVPVQTSSSGPSMTRLLLYGAVGVGIFFLGRKMGWW